MQAQNTTTTTTKTKKTRKSRAKKRTAEEQALAVQDAIIDAEGSDTDVPSTNPSRAKRTETPEQRERRLAKNKAAAAKRRAKKAVNQCLCGCGSLVVGEFAQGHDQRSKGQHSRAVDAQGTLFTEDIPAVALPSVVRHVRKWGFDLESRAFPVVVFRVNGATVDLRGPDEDEAVQAEINAAI